MSTPAKFNAGLIAGEKSLSSNVTGVYAFVLLLINS